MACAMINEARFFAMGAHGGQIRHGINEPYWKHLNEVAALIAQRGAPDEVIVAAWLHDVLEDTNVPSDMVSSLFGGAVVRMVSTLTDTPPSEGMNRSQRKEIDRNRLLRADRWTKTIKLADCISNIRTAHTFKRSFRDLYLHEKELLLPCLEGGDEILWREMRQLLLHFDRGSVV